MIAAATPTSDPDRVRQDLDRCGMGIVRMNGGARQEKYKQYQRTVRLEHGGREGRSMHFHGNRRMMG